MKRLAKRVICVERTSAAASFCPLGNSEILGSVVPEIEEFSAGAGALGRDGGTGRLLTGL